MPAAESAAPIPLVQLLPAEWNANRVPAATMAKIRRSAAQSRRRAYVMELDPGYCDVIRRRYESFVGAEAQ